MTIGCYGNCINSFDEEGESLIDLFDNVSDFACVEEESNLITIDDFILNTGLNRDFLINITKISDSNFLWNDYRQIGMIYNRVEDVHYFFKGKNTLDLELEINKYIPNELLNGIFKKYKKYIIDYYSENKETFIYGQKRDNCGVIAADFSLYMKSKGIIIERVNGEFKLDKGLYAELDFYKEELKEMKKYNLNYKLIEDRIKYCDLLSLHERQKKVPHYWNEDENGLIIDLSAYSQFVKNSLSESLDSKRYLNNNKNKLINKVKI